jgi:hypothetical protein
MNLSKPEPNALASDDAAIWAVREGPEANAYGSRGMIVEVLKCALVRMRFQEASRET